MSAENVVAQDPGVGQVNEDFRASLGHAENVADLASLGVPDRKASAGHRDLQDSAGCLGSPGLRVRCRTCAL